MLVSATEMINKAHEGHYAIGAFNINNMEWIIAILKGVEAKKSPVILEVSEGAAKYMQGFDNVVAMVKNIHDKLGITVPVALHLDHGSYDGAKAAIAAGFTSVMFDGSHYDFEENKAKSSEIIELAHSKGISVECEVGGIGGTEEGSNRIEILRCGKTVTRLTQKPDDIKEPVLVTDLITGILNWSDD